MPFRLLSCSYFFSQAAFAPLKICSSSTPISCLLLVSSNMANLGANAADRSLIRILVMDEFGATEEL